MRPLLFPILLLAVSSAWSAESLLPTALPESRYEKMMEKSPFALSTAAPVQEAPKESFAANWNLTGLAKMRDDQGIERDFVTVRSRDQRVAFSLFGDQQVKDTDPDVNGVSIESVDLKPLARKSTVTLRKGSEIAKIEFGQDSAPPPAPVSNRAGAQQPGVGAGRPPIVPGGARPQLPQAPRPAAGPRGNSIVPTPGNSIVPGQRQNPRVRVIPPPPH